MDEKEELKKGGDLAMPFYTAPVASDGTTKDINYKPPVNEENHVEENHVSEPVQNNEPVIEQPIQENVQQVQENVTPVQEVAPIQQSAPLVQEAKPMQTLGAPMGQVYSGPQKEEEKDRDRNVRAYIGADKYDYFLTKTFNGAFFLLGNWYLFYRKMYMKAISLTLISLILGYILTIFIPFDIVIILPYGLVYLIYSFKVNKFYYYKAQARVKKIEYTFSVLDDDKVEKICAERGKPSISTVITGFICYSLFITLLSTIIVTISTTSVLINGPDYDGTFIGEPVDESYVVFHPVNGYEKQSDENGFSVYTKEFNDGGTCVHKFGQVSRYKNADRVMGQMISLSEKRKKQAEMLGQRNDFPKYKKGTIVMSYDYTWHAITSSVHSFDVIYLTNIGDKLYYAEAYALDTTDADGSECLIMGEELVRIAEPQIKPETEEAN